MAQGGQFPGRGPLWAQPAASRRSRGDAYMVLRLEPSGKRRSHGRIWLFLSLHSRSAPVEQATSHIL